MLAEKSRAKYTEDKMEYVAYKDTDLIECFFLKKRANSELSILSELNVGQYT